MQRSQATSLRGRSLSIALGFFGAPQNAVYAGVHPRKQIKSSETKPKKMQRPSIQAPILLNGASDIVYCPVCIHLSIIGAPHRLRRNRVAIGRPWDL
jgi:hypothetical protein